MRYLRNIVSFVLVVTMLLINSTPAMAAEKVAETNYDSLVDRETDDTNEVARASLKGEFHYTGRLKKDKVLGTVVVQSASKTIQWTVGRTNSDGNVVFKITNTETGGSRSFTTVANNTLSSITYVSNIVPGTYEVSVVYTSSSWLYDVDLYFY